MVGKSRKVRPEEQNPFSQIKEPQFQQRYTYQSQPAYYQQPPQEVIPIQQYQQPPQQQAYYPLPQQTIPRSIDDKKSIFGNMFNRKRLKKHPKMVAVMYLRNNGKAQPMEVESKKGFFSIEKRIYNEDTDCIYRLPDGTPLAIIPEWSLIPYGTKQWHDKPMLEKFAELQDHTLRGIRHAELVRMGDDGGKKISPKVVIGLIILLIIGAAIFSQYLGG